MNDDSKENRCNSCGIDVPTYDGVHLSHENGTTEFLCSRCYDESVSYEIGLKFDHLSFHPITLTDNGDEDHDEQIQTIFEAIRQLMSPPEKPRKRIYPVKPRALDDVMCRVSRSPRTSRIWSTNSV